MAGRIKPQPTPPADAPMSMSLLGQYVKARRTQAGLRIDDAALLCGVAKDTLSRIENGNDSVHIASLLQVMRQLGIQLQVKPWSHGDAS